MSDPSTLIAPACLAYPKYAVVLNALASLMADDTPPVVPVTPPGPVVVPNPAATMLPAGRFVPLSGNGLICDFDFGDPDSAFNALRGYNAAHIYDTPGTYIATTTAPGTPSEKTIVSVAADTRPLISVTAGADLAGVLEHLASPTIVLLPPGITFDVKLPVTIAASGITLRAAAAGPAPRIRRIVSPGSYSTLIIAGSDVSIEGMEFDSDHPLQPTANVKVGVYALTVEGHNLLVRDCTFRGVDDGLHCMPQARGLVVVNCTFTNELRACAVYLDAMQDAVVLGINAVGSVCEHIVRLERAQNVLVHGSDVDNHDGKEAIAIRMGHFVAITENTIRTWARISEGIGAQPGVYCTHVVFAGNHFAGLRPLGPWLQINPGSQTVIIDGNTFDVDPQQACVAIQAPVTDVTLTSNQINPLPGTTVWKPLVRPFGNPAYTETGTTVLAAKG